MKTYKLWIEIEEYDSTTGAYRNVTTDGEASPVPVAEFYSLEEAVRLAELFAMDRRSDEPRQRAEPRLTSVIN